MVKATQKHDSTIITSSFTFHNEMEIILNLHEIILSFVVVGSLLTWGKHYNPDLNNTNYHKTITIEVIRNLIISFPPRITLNFPRKFVFLKSFVYIYSGWLWRDYVTTWLLNRIRERYSNLTNRHSQLNFVSGHERLNLNLNFTEETESKRNDSVVWCEFS